MIPTVIAESLLCGFAERAPRCIIDKPGTCQKRPPDSAARMRAVHYAQRRTLQYFAQCTHSLEDLPMDRLLNLHEVQRIVGLKKSAIYQRMQAGRFPRPMRLGPRTVRWWASEIEDWMRVLPRSTGGAFHRAKSAGRKKTWGNNGQPGKAKSDDSDATPHGRRPPIRADADQPVTDEASAEEKKQ